MKGPSEKGELFVVLECTCVPVVVCVARKLWPCLRDSRCRDRLIPYFCIAETGGGGCSSVPGSSSAPSATLLPDRKAPMVPLMRLLLC